MSTPVEQRYQEILAGLAPAMRAGMRDRVPLLRRILGALGHPDRGYRIVHLAGTNGKGSTGGMLARILQASGYSVGHFHSPALGSPRGQVLVDRAPLSRADFVAASEQILVAMPKDLSLGDLTTFEWWTLVAIVHFNRCGVDWAVLECGLGGQNDATNAIAAPALAVITHLALDHVRILGPSIQEIARAKAGIIKAGSGAVVLAPRQPATARQLIEAAAAHAGVPLVEAGREFQVTAAGAGRVRVTGPDGSRELAIHLVGDFQRDNLTTVLAAVVALRRLGAVIPVAAVTRVIAIVQLPGRMQTIGQNPLVVIDGAHNPDAIGQVCTTVNHHWAGRPLTLVVGVLADKAVAQMAAQLANLPARIIVTTPNHPVRVLPAVDLAVHFPRPVTVVPAPRAALAEAKRITPADGGILVTGSFYLIRELL